MLSLWFGTSIGQAACPTPSSTTDLASALDEAKTAYGNLEVDTFRAAMGRVHELTPCLSEEITRHLSAEIHRFEGLLGFLDRDAQRSQSAFARARAIEPSYHFPTQLVPEGNPVLAEYAALEPEAGGYLGVAEPLSGRLLFDGSTTTQRPSTLPSLFQRMDTEGKVLVTAYLWPLDPLPPYPEADPTQLIASEAAPPPIVRKGPRRGLLASAGAGLVTSGLLYGAAFWTHTRYLDPETDISKLDSLRTVNNGFIVASGATLAVTMGLGTGALLTGTF